MNATHSLDLRDARGLQRRFERYEWRRIMMDGMMGMMHGWMWLVVLLLAAILVGVVVLIARSGGKPRA